MPTTPEHHVADGAILVTTMDRSFGTYPGGVDGDLLANRQTKFHRPRTDDAALARCSRHIILNTEDIIEWGHPASPGRNDVCRRCVPLGTVPTYTEGVSCI